MKIQCPNCKRILNVAGLYLLSRENDDKITASGLQRKQILNCHYCDATFVPEPYKDSNEQSSQ